MKVLIWNIRLLGNPFPKSSKNSACADLADSLIVEIIKQYSADVVVIQEVTKNGYARMKNIQKILNINKQNIVWSSDALPGAIVPTARNLQQQDIVPINTDLDFTKTAHNEAYGVLWKGNALNAADTQMSNGAVSPDNGIRNGHYIDLVYTGNSPNPLKIQTPFVNYGLAGILNFPIPHCPDIVGDAEKDKNIFTFYDSRRACVVYLNSGGTSIPCVVYHTPASSPSNYYGSFIGLNSGPLRPNTNKKWIYGGDFNLKDLIVQRLVLERATNFAGYVDSNVDYNGKAAKSVVHYKYTDVPGWRGKAQYKTASRDYGFMRNYGSDSTISVIDPIQDLANGVIDKTKANLVADYLRFQAAFQKSCKYDTITEVISTLGFGASDMKYDKVSYNLAGIWKTISANLVNDQTPAENPVWILSTFLYCYLISDHLPVLVEF